jgi:hypothetical protein
MVSEEEKRLMLASLLERATIAEASGLLTTAKSWRDAHANLLLRPANEIIWSRRNARDTTVYPR